MKKVSFNEKLNQIYILRKWNFAFKQARMMYWEYEAIDRIRFQRRVKEISNILNPILDVNHRCVIYNKRFSN